MFYLDKLSQLVSSKILPVPLGEELRFFYGSYIAAALSNQQTEVALQPILTTFLDLVVEQIQSPFDFQPYHEQIRSPFDYYQFGIDFIRPLIIKEDSYVIHPDNLEEIAQKVEKRENVILFSNHQIELDPQAISLLLETSYPELAETMVFVAGHRVIQDHLAVPFSKGRNLLCIYSKKYVDDDPTTQEVKRIHNQHTMMRMSQLLSEGGKCIYVAPSGGRDRPDRHGHVGVAAFDPQSIEMFWLMAQRAEAVTHFYPLALSTYNLMPPPVTIKKNLGEPRYANATPIYAAFGGELEMEKFPGCDQKDKSQRRKARAHYIWQQVNDNYSKCPKAIIG